MPTRRTAGDGPRHSSPRSRAEKRLRRAVKRELLRARGALAHVNLQIAEGAHGDYWSPAAMAALMPVMKRYSMARVNYIAVFGGVVS